MSTSPSARVIQPPGPQFFQPPTPNLDEFNRFYTGAAQGQTDIFANQIPQLKAILLKNFPYLGTLEGQVGEQLSSDYSLTPQQQAAQDAIRGRSREQLTRGIRESANLGGTLYGGRRQEEETRGLGELEQAFVSQDIDRIRQQRAQTLAELGMLQGYLNPGTQSPVSGDQLLSQLAPIGQQAAIGFGQSPFSQYGNFFSNLIAAYLRKGA